MQPPQPAGLSTCHVADLCDVPKFRQPVVVYRDPKRRPSITTVACHPCWWQQSTKLQFLIDTSDSYELADRAADSSALQALEATAASAFPPGTNWATSLERTLIANLYQYRSYKYSSVRDLLRVIRNKCNHFREMPAELQALIGEPPDAYYAYFAARFPHLFLTMFFFVLSAESHTEALFQKYQLEGSDFSSCAAVHARRVSAEHTPLARLGLGINGEDTNSERSRDHRTLAAMSASANLAQARRGPLRTETGNLHDYTASASTSLDSSPTTVSTAPLLTTFPAREAAQSGSAGSVPELGSASERSPSESRAPVKVNGVSPAVIATPVKSLKEKKKQRRLDSRMATETASGHPSSPSPPPRPSLTNTELQSSPPPPPVPLPQPPLPMLKPPLAPTDFSRTPIGLHPPARLAMPLQVGWRKAASTEHIVCSFPQNPDKELCQFFVQTGTCRFGEHCFKHHPVEYNVPLNLWGYPIREEKQECPFYMQTGSCKFGTACKYHHPNLEPLFAGSDL
jgi:serine/threonine-protein kinase/endoribonuclease IRE1